MPHVIVEYTNNLRSTRPLDAVFRDIHTVLSETGGIALENCKSRAVQRRCFLIGDGAAPRGFVHADVRMLEGRSHEVKQAVGARILELLRDAFAVLPGTPDSQVTVEVRDIQRALYFKHPEGTLDYH